MTLRSLPLTMLVLASLTARAEELAWVWLVIPPGVAEEIRQSAEAEAMADIASDAMQVKGFGLAGFDEHDHYDRLLRKYHLTDNNLGCMPDERSRIAVKAYNAVIDAELEHRYGERFWERFDAELVAARQATRKGAESAATSTKEPNKPLEPIAAGAAPAEL